ncbi:LptF/LptG family permease [Marispirochaeta aestuarii]|uniref:LptF/LptG family permease n=1 Tax=Marispirochaeta aestuarii TaxID=1963862 RepID=UPI002ABD8B99|nr:LptF/LptG family permease [Marispirochaeta aestuarii]
MSDLAVIRRKTILFRYVAGEFVLSFAVVFLFFFFIFFINQILLMAEEILSKNVAPGDVLRLIVYAVPNIISYSFPFSALVGGLMAVGRLVGDNEILAMQSAGIPLKTIALPIFTLGLIFGVLAYFSNDVLLPAGTMRFNTLYREILYSNPALELEAYSIKRYRDRVIATGKVESGSIEDIVIFDRDEKKNRRTINASRGVLDKNYGSGGVISLRLYDVVSIVSDQKRRGFYEYSSADIMEYNILLKDISLAVHSLTPREKSIRDIIAVIKEKREQLSQRAMHNQMQVDQLQTDLAALYLETFLSGRKLPGAKIAARQEQLRTARERDIRDRSLQMHLLEYHKKIALPAACVIFLLFAFPAGVLTRKGGRSIGFGIGLFVCMLYWGLLFAGQTLGIRSDLSPWIAIWTGNLVILAAGTGLLVIRSRR